MSNKGNKKNGKKGKEDPIESESDRVHREIEETIAEMESGIDRLRRRFRKMQEQLGDLHRHLYPEDNEGESEAEAMNWDPGKSGNALMA